jgi:penicillin-insensitive murein endopeptidase
LIVAVACGGRIEPPGTPRKTEIQTAGADAFRKFNSRWLGQGATPIRRAALIFTIALLLPAVAAGAESACFGTVARGRLENGVALPAGGPNFSSYSTSARALGRTYVHSNVRDVVLAAYRNLEKAAPGKVFVYGETGWKSGGRIRPHRTHQNGLSVDFMVPVLDKAGRSVPLPTNALNRFGYDIEFDDSGRYRDLEIDFPAIAEHLYQLHLAARAQGIGIALVIFDPPYLPRLLGTERGPYLKENLKFMKGKPWVRHDEHYHVDFSVECKPLPG